MGKFCTNCGTQVQEGAKFCFTCGVPIKSQDFMGRGGATERASFSPQGGNEQAKSATTSGKASVQAQFATQSVQPPQPYTQPQAQQAYQPQYAQQPQGGIRTMVEKQNVLRDAPNALNRPDQPWQVTVEGDAIVARWKWMDATFFAPHEVTNETKDYSFTVILDDKGKWKEIDRTEQKSAGVNMSGGKIGFGTSSQKFMGKTNQKSFSFGTGVNNQTGEAGLIRFKFDTSLVKKPIRAYLESCGWKKPGLFG